ncbi:salicylate synthase, partial [Pluralibacter gergoviae]
ARGEYQKVILSRRIEVDDNIDLLASFRLGRQHNTPARAFAVRLGEEQFVGFSPETVVEVSTGGAVSTQPLAGTRALTADEAENRRLREVLTGDTKEIAEHAVSVKLAFEELAPLCEEGSTRVSDFMSVSLRGSVQHLASRVEGQLRAGCSGWDAFAALFPAVTASGIPKAPAIAAIRRLEPTPRGAYSGSVFWLSSKGELDAALVLRSLYRRDGGYSLQAGAGIIDQSQPARELEETIEKLESVSRFLVRAR